MVVVCCKGGLGNQMFQYAFAINLERYYDVEIDISWYDWNKEKFKLEQYFDVNFSNVSKEKRQQLSDFDSRFLSKVKKKIFRKKTHIIEDQNKVLEKLDNRFVFGDYFLDGYWQSYKYLNGIESQIYELYFPNNCRKKTNDVINKKINNAIPVSLHIRRGDYVGNSVLELLDINYYIDAINYMKKKYNNVVFIVCSNDINWVQTKLKNNNLIFVDWTKTDLEDLYIMASCSHNIIANSSFSLWSALLNRNIDKTVIYPKKWFKKIQDNSYMFPSKWVSL